VAQNKTATKTAGKRPTTARSMKKSGKKAIEGSDDIVTIDRRRSKQRRDDVPAAAEATPAGPTLERRKKVTRRRQIDPTTCERDYSEQEVEFMNALDDYKRKSGRMFPTCSEVLEVIRSLGYVKDSAGVSSTNDGAVSAKPMAANLAGWVVSETPASFGATATL
jgi:hypothetical protein